MTPPTGGPAQRSALSIGVRPDPDDDRTSLVERPEPPDVRWKQALVVLRQRGPARYGLIGLLALLQVFVLFSAVMWLLGSSAPTATATVAPMTWTGVVYDVGAAGVNLRSAAQVRPDDSRDTAARGARLALSCGQTGDVVSKGDVRTATWLKTSDGLFVSMLYVHVPERASIPSCDGSKVDGPLVALADPANPQLPPPPGVQLDGSGVGRDGDTGTSGPASAQAAGRRGAGVTPQGSNGVAVAAAPAGGAPIAAPGHAPAAAPTAKPTIGTGSATATTTAPAPVPMTGNGIAHQAHPRAVNPDTTPVG